MSIAVSSPGPVPAAVSACDRPDSAAARLGQSRLFHDYRAAFEVATGLQLALIARHPREGARGRFKKESVRGALTLSMDGASEERISALPIRVGELTIAWLRVGPFLARAGDGEFRALRPRSGAALPRLGPAAHRSILRLLGVFALHLAEASNDLIIDLHLDEPPFVQTARRYIEAHLTEDLSLTVVAAAVHISPYYFCKRFRESAGVHFTEFVNRARIARVKERLLNPHVHVSEAAFAAGFQSLSQFNRAFRRVTGESPSTFRHRLHAMRAAAPAPHAA